MPRCAHNDSYELAQVQFVGDYSEEMEQSADVQMRAGLKKMRASGGVNGYLDFSANRIKSLRISRVWG
ncbi:hypothetical protein DLK05_05295 [Ancylomarina longa]|uniref:Uncharacterized protein n=1 Tax=Ancylomarina longa TaxID=2487017 RepID=A0A434AWM3_9BACT|nr:hypothetical protein DLK05_05295 [Ancylomarina longa]